MSRWSYLLIVPLGLGLAGALLLAFAVALVYPQLPPLDALTRYRPQVPLRIYTADGTQIGEFGEERRAVIRIAEVPPTLKHAILAAEDARFYEHGGIDYSGIARAALADLGSGARREGASTITMQLARNLFLTPDKTFGRKFAEALLSYRIENSLTKDEILERYINQIYLGQRTYGFAAAAQIYFGKPLGELTLAQAALLAGLPKAPARYNPINHHALALERRRYVLNRMLALGYITDTQYREAAADPLRVSRGHMSFAVDAPFAAEAVRQMILKQIGETAYTAGYRVYTTLRDADQAAADAAVRGGVLAYDQRHGYRGPEASIDLPGDAAARDRVIDHALSDIPAVNGLEPAVVLRATPAQVVARMKGAKILRINGAGLKFAQRALQPAAPEKLRLRAGSLIRVDRNPAGQWEIAETPQAEAALVSIDPASGAVLALCGGFDFNHDKFNHAMQAFRQPGSSFKPFVYSAALEKGFMPATLVDDSPLVVPASYPGGKPWAPHNYENDFLGPITVRRALALSRNVAAARVIETIGVPYAHDYVTRFGFPAAQVPPYPTMVLGAGSFTPVQMAEAYAVFANGGFRVTPYLVDRVVDSYGNVIYQAAPRLAGKDAPRVIDPRNAFIMTSMLQDVTRSGTAARARALGRRDIAGKTGTTENYVDAWFDGYTPQRVAVAWIGFDQPQSLGKGEVGARAALPMWMDYMRAVLKGVPDQPYVPPDGVVSEPVDPASGQIAAAGQSGASDYFYEEDVPAAGNPPPDKSAASAAVKNELF